MYGPDHAVRAVLLISGSGSDEQGIRRLFQESVAELHAPRAIDLELAPAAVAQGAEEVYVTTMSPLVPLPPSARPL